MKKVTRLVAAMCSTLLLMGVAATARADESPDGSPTMEQRMQRLEDREAILELLVTYGRLLDKKDLVGYSNLFAEDGVWEGGIGSATGPKGIQDMLTRVFGRVEPGAYGSDYHIMSDFNVSVDSGNTATAWSRWTWLVEGPEGKPVAQRSGHYEDTLVKVGGQWKFKHRLTITSLPTPEKDSEAEIFRKDHRDTD